MEVKIKLSQKQSDAWHYLNDKTTTELLYGGAAGGGKSLVGCLWKVNQRVKYPETRGITGRKELKSIKESTLITYFKAAKWLGYHSGFDFKFNAQDMTILWKNGSKEIFKDLKQEPSDPNFESLGSTEFTDAFIDEAGEVVEKAVEIVNSRLRWMISDYDLVPKLLLTCNPNINWIKHKYIKSQEGEIAVLKHYQKYIRATVEDNNDEGFKKLYREALEKMNSYDKARLLYGDWDAIPKSGGEIYKSFNGKKHTGDCVYNEDLPLHISFDENVNPYFPCVIFQVQDKSIFLIDLILGRSPNNSIKWVTNEFKRRYPNHTSGLFIYGDATSQKGDVKQEEGHDLFRLIKNNLTEYNPSIRVNPSNPSVKARLDFINAVFESNNGGISFMINSKLHDAVMDFEQTKEASDGTKDKKTVRDPMTGVSYQPYGHISDCFDYMICYAFKSEFERFKRGNRAIDAISILGSREYNERSHY